MGSDAPHYAVGRGAPVRAAPPATAAQTPAMVNTTSPLKNRQHALHAVLHLAIPQLQVATAPLLPVRVEIEQRVQSTVKLERLVPVEVDVHA